MNYVFESWMLILALAIFMGLLGAYHSHHSPIARLGIESKQNLGDDLQDKKEVRSMAKDPVCGMTVDEKTPAAASEFQNKTYYFCSEHCKQQFDKEPTKFVQIKYGRAHH